MTVAEVIAWTWAAVMTGAVVGVLSPDLRRRCEPQVSQSTVPAAESVHLPPPAPENLLGALQKPDMEVAEETAVAVEAESVARVVPVADPKPPPDWPSEFDIELTPPVTEKILTKHQRRSKRNGGGRKRRRGHGRR